MIRFAQTCLLTLLAVVVAGCHRGPTEQEKQVMAQLTQSMKTQCVGRYLVDLPDSFNWLDPNITLYYGRDENFKTLDVNVLDDKATSESVVKEIAARATKISAETLDKTGKSTLLAQVKEGDGGVMLRYYSDSSGVGIDHQLHLLIGHAHVLIKGSSYEGVSEDKEDLSPAVEARMLKLATHIHPIGDPEKTGPGFCLGGVVIDSDNDYEQGTLYFGKGQGKSKMTLEVDTSSFKERDSTAPDLLHRGDKFMSFVTSLKTLRKGTLTLGGMPAQEVLTTTKVDGKDAQFFVSETNAPDSSVVKHKLHFEFQAGRADGGTADAPSPLTDNEAVGLWDAIMKSVRPRPNAARSGSSK